MPGLLGVVAAFILKQSVQDKYLPFVPKPQNPAPFFRRGAQKDRCESDGDIKANSYQAF